jgi:carotenoid cleavage dioxygenase
VERRDFLIRGALGVGGVLSYRLVAPSLAHATARTAADDTPLDAWWSRGNYAPLSEELTETRLRVTGALPPELNGLYVRNGTDAHPGTAAPHWFIGDGMVHGVRLSDGDARWYRNRFVQTKQLPSDAPLGSGGPPTLADGFANVSVIWHGDHLLASGEIGLPWELAPADLSTVGMYDFAGKLTTSMTAHPKIDPETGAMHFFGYWFAEPFLTYHVADASGALVHSEVVDVAGPTMIHDFAITDRDVVFWELPVVFDPSRIDTGIPYSWDPSYGARIGIMPLGGPASAIRWREIDPCFVFHGVNAQRDGKDVVVDVCRHERMFDPGVTDSGALSLRRWRLGTGGDELTFSEDVVDDRRNGELPTRDPRRVGREYRYGYLVTTAQDGPVPVYRGVAKQDFRTGEVEEWRSGRGRQPNEFLFVPTGRGEDDGYLLTYVYDEAKDRSDLAVLDARDVSSGPVATVHLPTRVPYGFHATWVPEPD